MNKFRPGDVVGSVTGSPPMTIGAVHGEMATCQWFSRDDSGRWATLNEADFHFEALRGMTAVDAPGGKSP